MAFAIRRRPPLKWHKFPDIFLPHFFLLQLNPTYLKRILHIVSVKKITLKSYFNWFNYWHSSASPAADCQLFSHIHGQPQLLYVYKAQTMCETRFDSQEMILNCFF